MTERVALQMESMIPELSDYQERELFSEFEIKQIVQKRRDFEYKINRKIPLLADFKRYIEYELHLEQLRKKRRDRFAKEPEPETDVGKKKAKDKMSVSDVAIIKRIHQLYLKACNKFNDIPLWKEYLEWTIEQKSFHVFTRNVSKAIQMNTQEPLFWIMAANFEFQNGNMNNARVLMQKSLRCNPEIEKLWIEYCRLELLYLFKIKIRHQILFGNEQISTEELPGGDVEVNIDPALQQTLKDMTIPKTIVKAAFQEECASVIDMIYDSLLQDFGNDVVVIGRCCKRRLHFVERSSELYPARLGECIDDFLKVLDQSRDPLLWQVYLDFLIDERRQTHEDALIKYIDSCLCNALEEASSRKICTPQMYRIWFDLTSSSKKLKAGLKQFPESEMLWKAYIQQSQDKLDAYKQALEKVTNFELWMEYIECLKTRNHKSVLTEYQRLLELFLNTPHESKALLGYLSILEGSTFHETYQYHINRKQQPLEFFEYVLDREIGTDNHSKIQVLFQRAHDAYPSNTGLWLKHLGYLLKHDPVKAAQVYWLAEKQSDDKQLLKTEYHILKEQ